MILIVASFEAAKLNCVPRAGAAALTDGQSSPSEVDRKLMMVGFSPARRLPKGFAERIRAAGKTNPAVGQPPETVAIVDPRSARDGIPTRSVSAKERV